MIIDNQHITRRKFYAFSHSAKLLYTNFVKEDNRTCAEHTKAVDGYLMPDIPIPYVAEEYMTGRDAMLDRLLEIIK